MGIYTDYVCPKCRNTLQSLVPYKAKGIGKPFQVCHNCGSFVVMKELLNEWELLSDREKSEMRSRARWTGIQMGGMWGFVAGMILGSFTVSHPHMPRWLSDNWMGIGMLTALVMAIVGAILYTKVTKSALLEDIANSTERMRDIEYRKVLEILGLFH
jgi:MFS family permease